MNNSDPSGVATQGYCVSINASAVIPWGQVSICNIETTNGQQVGESTTAGYGFGATANGGVVTTLQNLANGGGLGKLANVIRDLVEVSGDATWQTNNAANSNLLKGKFLNSLGTVVWGLGGGWEKFHGLASSAIAADWSLGVGTGVAFSQGESWTAVQTWSLCNSSAHIASDEINAQNVIIPASWGYGG